MIMPSHAKNVKLYTEGLPLFARYQVESYLASMFNPTVQLPSGGYIVIGVTEALVAVDVNSGRATKEGSIEQTALKTNLEASDEVARQLRLRDLAGLIVIDYIDMDERKNNAAVEKRMKDKLKTDRARIQVGRISGFGLMEMSRQRLRPGMIEATTQPCQACHGTGLIRSDDSLALSILRQIEEEGTRKRSREVLIKAPVGIANFLMNQKREHIAHIEARYGLSVRIEGDPMLVSPDFSLEKFKTATRVVPVAAQHVVSVDTSLMDQVDADDEEIPAEVAEHAVETPNTENNVENDGEDRPKRRRRRRRRRNKNGNGEAQTASDETNAEASDAPTAETPKEAEPSPESAVDASAAKTDDAPAAAAEQEEAPAKPKRTRSRTRKPKVEVVAEDAPEAVVKTETAAPVEEAAPAEATEEAPAKPKRKRASRAKKADPVEAAPDADAAPVAPEVESASVEEEPAPAAPAPEPAGAEPEPVAAEAAPEPAKPKRRGWWSIGG